MDKRKLIVIIGIIIIITSFVFIFLIRKLKPQPEITLVPTPTQYIYISPTPFPQITRVQFSVPPGNKINVSGIDINNVYKFTKIINDRGDVDFLKNNDYEFTYLPEFQKFYITILSTPFENVRIRAENSFIQTLGITRSEACKLKVDTATTIAVDPQHAGKSYALSFCAAPSGE